MTLIRYRDLTAQPWKNGLGLTREIAMDPDERFAVGFGWRLSRAEVRETSAFSRFEGVRRWLGLASGGAFELRIEGRPPHTLERAGDVLAFPGDVACEGVPLLGPIEDLNLMVADPQLDAEMLLRPMVGTLVLSRGQDHVSGLHILDGSITLQGGSTPALGAGDTLIIDEQSPGLVRGVGAGHALFFRVFAR
ncbi:MAG: HutD family protein [Ahniella sp.]|nr:HutD family protein [Ahniella sp.]